MKYCAKCGGQVNENAKFCVHCGAPLTSPEPAASEPVVETPAAETLNYTYTPVSTEPAQKQNYNYEYNTGNAAGTQQGPKVANSGITQRSIVVAIILTIVTCGLYGIYWMIKLNDEINVLAGEPNATSGAMVFLLSIVTCGIYSFFWIFKMGERCDRIKGITGGNSNVLYLVISLLGFGIVVYCLMQDTINKAV